MCQTKLFLVWGQLQATSLYAKPNKLAASSIYTYSVFNVGVQEWYQPSHPTKAYLPKYQTFSLMPFSASVPTTGP